MKDNRFPVGFLFGLLIVFVFSIAFFIRVYYPSVAVFGGDWIKFTGVDAYYHMRLVDNLVHNFPNLIQFDPYFSYPYGHWLGSFTFFHRLLASIIWLVGLGDPT